MKFIVQVPAYVRLEVEADGPVEAAADAERLIERRQGVDLLHGGSFVEGESVIRDANVLLLDPDEDRTPDVFICRGGKLAYIGDSGIPEPVGEDCAVG
jgi:hypothetical protein